MRTAAHRVLVAALAVAAGSSIAGQRAAPPVDQPPTFKINVDFVEVDAFVADASGNFVRNLQADDFEVLEDGKRQTIATFGLVDIPVTPPVADPASPRLVERDVVSNEGGFDGRVYVMVIDDLHTNFARTGRVRSAARAFIEKNLGPNDLMAIIHTAGPSDGNQDFTASRRLLLDAIQRTAGRKLDSATLTRTNEFFRLQGTNRGAGDPATDTSEDERVMNARRSLGTLRDVAQWFARINGRRKAILFLSEGIDYDLTNWADNPSASVITGSIRDAISAAAKGNVAIYGIDPRGLTTFADDTIGVAQFPADPSQGLGPESLRRELVLAQSSLRELSGQTGGFAVLNQTDMGTAFDRIVRDNSSYYVLAYYPPPGKVGSFHKIDVRVTRPGVTVRARQGYVTAKPVSAAELARTDGGPADPKKLLTATLREAIDSPLPLGGVVMNAFAAPFKGTAPDASVLVGVEMRGRDLHMDARGKLTLAVAAVDSDGKIRGGATEAVSLNLSAELKDRVAQTGLRMLNRMDLPPGRYQLRIASEDASGGNLGALIYDLDVPDFTKDPLTMSAVVITSAAASGQPTVKPDESLRQVLPAPPVASRVFPRNDQIALFAEVYDNQASSPHKVDIAATIATDDGRVVFKKEDTRDASEIQGKRGGYGFSAIVPMKDFVPGAYVLTVSATSRLGNNDLPVQRRVPFTVTDARPIAR